MDYQFVKIVQLVAKLVKTLQTIAQLVMTVKTTYSINSNVTKINAPQGLLD